MNKTEKAYKEIIALLEKYREDIVFDVDYLKRQAEKHIFGVALVEKRGFNLDPTQINSTDWQKLKENIYIGFFDGERRKISWSDDGRQPKNELLLNISFPTGAYIFGGDYPTEFFNQFFSELKSYKPSYVDTRNNNLYYNLENGAKVFNDYDKIMKKYQDLNKKDRLRRKAEKMRKELEEIEGQL